MRKVRCRSYDGHSFRRVYERQGLNAFNGFAVARGVGSGLCRLEQVRRDDALRRAEYYLDVDDRATGEVYCLAHHVTVDADKRV